LSSCVSQARVLIEKGLRIEDEIVLMMFSVLGRQRNIHDPASQDMMRGDGHPIFNSIPSNSLYL